MVCVGLLARRFGQVVRRHVGILRCGGTDDGALWTTATLWHQQASSFSSSSSDYCVRIRKPEDLLALMLDVGAHGRASERPADPRCTEQSLMQGFNEICAFPCVITTISHQRELVPDWKASRKTRRRHRDAYTARPRSMESSSISYHQAHLGMNTHVELREHISRLPRSDESDSR